jgi:hypothetical protein
MKQYADPDINVFCSAFEGLWTGYTGLQSGLARQA